MAGASELEFSYSSSAGANTEYAGLPGHFSFDLSSDPVPTFFVPVTYPFGDSYKTTGYFGLTTTNWQGNIADPGSIIFYSSIPVGELFSDPFGDGFADGGFSLILNDYIEAPQFYSGPESSPHFAVGTYNIIFGDNSGPDFGSAVVTITALAVPEPATWSLMLVGTGAIGYAMRRRARAILTYN